MPPNTPPIAVVYAARSTKDEHGSIPDQVERCREYATSQGWEVAEPAESDEAASAYHGSRGPGLVRAKARAAALAQEGRETILLVFVSDRLARGNGREGAHLVEHVLDGIKAGYRVESATENLGGEMALVFASLYGERAHADSKAKSEHTRRGLHKMVRGGRWHGPAPYGYVMVGRHEEQHLEIDEAAAAIVRRIFDEYVAGAGTAMIALHLNEDGVRPPRAERWDRSTIALMLDQVAYIRLVKFNGETYRGNHRRIIKEAVWNRAQAQRQARKPGTSHIGRPPNGTHLLVGGMLRCGVCGASMRPRSPGGVRQDRYECSNRNTTGGYTRCSMKGVLRVDIDEPLLRYLETVVFDIQETRRTIAEEHARRSSENAALIAQAEREVAEADASLTRIRADYSRGAITAEQWQGFQVEHTEAREAAIREVDQLTERANQFILPDVDEEVAARLAALREAVAGEVTGAKGLAAVRAALQRCFVSITLWQTDEDGLLLVPTVRALDELTTWLDVGHGRALSMPRPEPIAVPGQQGVREGWFSPSFPGDHEQGGREAR
jgi:site-specific DNA recombinase